MECGANLLAKHLVNCCPNVDETTKWNRWIYVPHEGSSSKKKTSEHLEQSDGKEKPSTRKLVLMDITGKVTGLIDTIVTDIGPFAQHSFIAVWQQDKFRHLKNNVPDNTLVQVLDFGQNYLCTFQDEAQGAHWYHNQVTIHPIVCYYKCTCSETIRNDVIVISPDLKHDRHAVKAFEKVASSYIHNERKINFDRKIQFTDGAASQYKSTFAFHDVSEEINTERNFFGSRHGKGPADAAIGQVKSAVRRAVRSRQVIIKDASDMYHYCKANLGKRRRSRRSSSKRKRRRSR